jgi:hypothetical protein
VGYEAGPINVGFAYGKTETGATTPDFKNYNIQLNYKFGFATLHTLCDVKEWNPCKTKDLSIGATVPVGPGALKVGYTRADRSGGPRWFRVLRRRRQHPPGCRVCLRPFEAHCDEHDLRSGVDQGRCAQLRSLHTADGHAGRR